MSIRFFDPKNEINFVKYFNPLLLVALLVPVVAVVFSFALGINWGIDFQGGAEMQVLFDKDVGTEEIAKVLEEQGFEKHQVQRWGEKDSKERLVRVEKRETFAADDVKKVEAVVKASFAGLDVSKIRVHFDPTLGDSLMVYLPQPAVENASEQAAVAAAHLAQREELARVLDTKTGFQVRRNDRGSMNDSVKPSDPKNGVIGYDVQFTGVSDKIATALKAKFGANTQVRRTEFVDSQVSGQLRTTGALAVLYALLAILVYIAIRFDFFFAPGAIVALVQDTFGAFLVFTFGRYEFDLPSVAALLTVLGVSINNTIVVYDRIRETVPNDPNKTPDEATVVATVNKAVNDTLSRTINTTLTTVIASACLWWFAGGVISSFAMVLVVGLSLGALSSTFAAPATYLLMRKRFGHLGAMSKKQAVRGQTREDKLKGVV